MLFRLLFVSVFFQLSFLYNASAQNKVEKDSSLCLDMIEKYSDFWIKDGVGKHGVREIICREFLSKCNFVGLEWKNMAKYFGTPNHKFTIENEKVFRYRLNYYSPDIKGIGIMLLDIDVNKKGIIIRFSIYSIDG